MRQSRALLAGLVLLFLGGASSPTSAAESPRNRAQRLHRAGRYPDQLDVDGVAGSGVPQRDGPSARRDAPPSSSSWSLGGPGTNTVLLVMLCVVLAIVFGGVLAAGRPRPTSLPGDAEDEVAPPEGNAAPAGLAFVRGSPEELAAAGRFEEAVVALLLQALRHVGWQPVGEQRSLTVREVLARLGTHDPRVVAFSELVDLHESIAFAGRTADANTYRRAHDLWTAMRSPEEAAG
ncbi:MAG: DUF4129 domain-containing protein [Myxococcota bacterium]